MTPFDVAARRLQEAVAGVPDLAPEVEVIRLLRERLARLERENATLRDELERIRLRGGAP